MVPAGAALHGHRLSAPALALCLLLLPAVAHPQAAHQQPEKEEDIARLFAEERWQEVVGAAQAVAHPTADVAYFHGVALSRLDRLEDAQRVLAAAAQRQPTDKRFPLALAGVRFRQGAYASARVHLRHALRLHPADAYAADFLATVYLLERNLEAALLHWNRVDKPRIATVERAAVSIGGGPELDPVLFDHALGVPPGAVLRLDHLHAARARLEMLNVFRRADLTLAARPDGDFDLRVATAPHVDLRSQPLLGAIAFFRGLPYQAVHPEFFNLRGQGMNLLGMYRFHAQRRRAYMELSAPLVGDPMWRWELLADVRDENWDLTGAFLAAGTVPVTHELKLQKAQASAAIRRVVNGRLAWRTGAELSHRNFRAQQLDPAFAEDFLAEGNALKHTAALDIALLRMPEQRLTALSAVGWDWGRVFARGRDHFTFGRIHGSVETRWLPGVDDTHVLLWQVRAAHTAGRVPFDELFLLGLERDTPDLALRGRRAARGGRKGAGPMGRSFLLSTVEFDRRIYRGPLGRAWLGPFLDGGQTWDPSPLLGTRQWQWDTGLQLKFVVLQDVGVNFTLGRDLRRGSNIFFVSLAR